MDGVTRRGTGTTVKAGDQDDFGACLGNAGGNGANACFADQLYIDSGLAVGAFQVIDQLGQVFD